MNARRTILVFVCGFAAIGITSGVRADFTFGEPVNLGPIVNCRTYQQYPSLSADGLSLYFDGTDDNVTSNLYVAMRETAQHPWGPPVSLGAEVNSAQDDWAPHISADGLELYFTSKRPGGDVKGRDDIWVARRANPTDEWSTPVNAGPNVNTDNWDTTPYLSQDGLTLYFTSGRYNEYHGWVATDLYMSHRSTRDAPWEPSVNLGPVINDYSFDYDPALSPDGLLLLFSSDRGVPSDNSDNTQSAWFDLWMTSRPTVESVWTQPVQPQAPLNTDQGEWSPSISRDGTTLFFASQRTGGYGKLDIWQAPILPVVDFNADGSVDLADLVLLVDNWGTDNTLYDIGPYAWGDGVVDIEDLKVFITHWEKSDPANSQDEQ